MGLQRSLQTTGVAHQVHGVEHAKPSRPHALAVLHLHCRWRKSPAELALMRRSAQLAAAAMTQCMQQSRPGVHEHQLAATFEYQ